MRYYQGLRCYIRLTLSTKLPHSFYLCLILAFYRQIWNCWLHKVILLLFKYLYYNILYAPWILLSYYYYLIVTIPILSIVCINLSTCCKKKLYFLNPPIFVFYIYRIKYKFCGKSRCRLFNLKKMKRSVNQKLLSIITTKTLTLLFKAMFSFPISKLNLTINLILALPLQNWCKNSYHFHENISQNFWVL